MQAELGPELGLPLGVRDREEKIAGVEITPVIDVVHGHKRFDVRVEDSRYLAPFPFGCHCRLHSTTEREQQDACNPKIGYHNGPLLESRVGGNDGTPSWPRRRAFISFSSPRPPSFC